MVSGPQMAARLAYLGERGATTWPPSTRGGAHQDVAGYVYVADELLVAAPDTEAATAALGPRGRGRGRPVALPGWGTIQLAPDLDPFEVAEELRASGRRLGHPRLVLTLGPHWSWGSASDPVPVGPLGPPAGSVPGPVTVGVVDTGMFKPVPPGLGLGTAEDDPVDVNPPRGFVDWFGAGHGGFVAGVIDHHADGARIDVYRGFDAAVDLPTEDAVIAAVDRALAGGAVAINLSVGTYGPYGAPPAALTEAMRRWKSQHPGLLMVAAAGNEGLTDPWYPAGFAGIGEFADWVVSVGGLGPDGNRATFSNHGPWVNAWAPAVDVHSHYPKGIRFQTPGGPVSTFTDGFARWSGTSFAAPRVLAAIVRRAGERGISPLAAWTELRTETNSF